MDIAELKNQDNMQKIEVEGEISSISEPREVEIKNGQNLGKVAKVADAILKDTTESITLTLWDDQIDQVHVGSKIKVENGYTTSFRGNVQLNVGRYGKLEILS